MSLPMIKLWLWYGVAYVLNRPFNRNQWFCDILIPNVSHIEKNNDMKNGIHKDILTRMSKNTSNLKEIYISKLRIHKFCIMTTRAAKRTHNNLDSGEENGMKSLFLIFHSYLNLHRNHWFLFYLVN